MSRTTDGGWARRLGRRRRRLGLLSVLVATVLVLAAGAVAVGLLAERGEDEPVAALCGTGAPVRVVVDPTLAPTLERAVAEAAGQVLSTGVCADVEVVAEDPATTASTLAAAAGEGADGPTGGTDELPDLWVPDSSVWLGRAAVSPAPAPAGSAPAESAPAGSVPDESAAESAPAESAPAASAPAGSTPAADVALTTLGSLVSSPVVLATSPQVVQEAGWTTTGPTWAAAFSSGRGVALPELTGSAVGLQALVALRTSVVDPEQARAALTAAAVELQRGTVPDAAAAMALVAEGGTAAPLAPTTEQQVFAANRGAEGTAVVGVHPSDAETSLDYPLVRVDTPDSEAGVDAAAVEGVVRLLEQQGRAEALTDGFSPPLAPPGEPSPGTSVPPSAAATGTAPAPSPEPPAEAVPVRVPVAPAADVDVLLAQLAELSRPSRVLAVFDASASMRGVTDTGATRAQVAQDAAKGSLDLFPDTAAIGLWFFAVGMGPGGADHVEVVPVRPLDPAAGTDQRAALAAGIDSLPDRLTPGGTGLYDTALAAVRTLRESYDPEASNSVVLVTDGREQDPDGISQEDLVATLRAEADPDRPVRIIAIGLSDDVDAEELTTVAEATGGAAYLAERPEDFQAVLFDALRRR